jgi:hypothetical protein
MKLGLKKTIAGVASIALAATQLGTLAFNASAAVEPITIDGILKADVDQADFDGKGDLFDAEVLETGDAAEIQWDKKLIAYLTTASGRTLKISNNKVDANVKVEADTTGATLEILDGSSLNFTDVIESVWNKRYAADFADYDLPADTFRVSGDIKGLIDIENDSKEFTYEFTYTDASDDSVKLTQNSSTEDVGNYLVGQANRIAANVDAAVIENLAARYNISADEVKTAASTSADYNAAKKKIDAFVDEVKTYVGKLGNTADFTDASADEVVAKAAKLGKSYTSDIKTVADAFGDERIGGKIERFLTSASKQVSEKTSGELSLDVTKSDVQDFFEGTSGWTGQIGFAVFAETFAGFEWTSSELGQTITLKDQAGEDQAYKVVGAVGSDYISDGKAELHFYVNLEKVDETTTTTTTTDVTTTTSTTTTDVTTTSDVTDVTTTVSTGATDVTSTTVSTGATDVTSTTVSTGATDVTSTTVSTGATDVTSTTVSTGATDVTSTTVSTGATDVTDVTTTDVTDVTTTDVTDVTTTVSTDGSAVTTTTTTDSTPSSAKYTASASVGYYFSAETSFNRDTKISGFTGFNTVVKDKTTGKTVTGQKVTYRYNGKVVSGPDKIYKKGTYKYNLDILVNGEKAGTATAYVAVRGDIDLDGEAKPEDATVVLLYNANALNGDEVQALSLGATKVDKTDKNLEALAKFVGNVTAPKWDDYGSYQKNLLPQDATGILIYNAYYLNEGKWGDWAYWNGLFTDKK